jgi:nucleoside-diphosphate-sugar epimerase
MEPVPISPYATTKLAAEGFCRNFSVVHGLETVALRYFNVFGPRQDPASQYSAVIPRFISALMRGEPPMIYGDGEQSRDFTYVDDVVNANLLAADSPAAAGNKYNVACGRRVTVNELYGEIADLIGVDIEPIYGPPRPGDIAHTLASLDAARTDLAYEPAISLREGLTITVDHLAQFTPVP